MTRAQKAKENFTSGYNCAQSVLLAFCDDVTVPSETLAQISLPFGGGMGRLRQTCGAVSGAVMAIGLLFPELSKTQSYELVQEFVRRFTAQNGSINCGELLSGGNIKAETSPLPEARTAEYYEKRPCADLVYDGAEILEGLCRERGRL